jgi:tRNA pseudouridine38-40 synthase
MQRIALGVEYNGADFHGFQLQQSAVNTVQQQLQAGLSSIADEPITLVCAGRTDAGVHATEQVVHFDTLSDRPLQAWSLGVNARLPAGISVRWAQNIGPDFHARFSALSRQYRYVINNSTTRPALFGDQLTWFKRPLNIGDMVEAARCLVGEHDFSALRAAQCQAKSPIRAIHKLAIGRWQSMLAIDIQANAFLHHMVRNIAGCLLAIGAGDKPIEWMQTVLDGRDRNCAAATASARGLYLVKVEYPQQFALPQTPIGPLLLPADVVWQQC